MNQREITKNLRQNEVHSDPDLILRHSSLFIDKEPFYLSLFFFDDSYYPFVSDSQFSVCPPQIIFVYDTAQDRQINALSA